MEDHTPAVEVISQGPKCNNKEVNVSGGRSEGLFVEAEIHGKMIPLLVDTGASATILSEKVVKSLNPDVKISPVNINLVTATGDKQPFLGECEVLLKLGDLQFKQKVLIADIHNDGILGTDFYSENLVSICFATKCLQIKNINVPCFQYTSVQECSRVTLAKDEILLPNTEKIVQGHLIDPWSRGSDGVVEPSKSFCNRYSGSVLVARVLVEPRSGVVPLRILNLSDESLTLRDHTVIATVETLSEVKSCTRSVNRIVCKEDLDNQEMPSHLVDLFEKSKVGLDVESVSQLKRLLISEQDTFSKNSTDIGITDLVEHKIDTGNAKPIKQAPRRIPLAKLESARQEIKDMEEKNVIEPSDSPWCSPVVLVTKKDQSIRFCLDFRKLNDVTVKDSHPLPRIDDTIDCLSGSKWFSTLDLKSGYWQIRIAKEDRPKTAFSIPGGGLWQFVSLAFGLTNAGGTFERMMEKILSSLTFKICLVYLDDIIVFSRSFSDHIDNLRLVIEKLREAGLKLNPKKCVLFKKEVKFLGHVVSENGVATDPEKTKSVSEWPIPKSVKQIRSFLGLCSYYRKFVFNFSDIARPLHKLTENKVPFVWTNDCQVAFEKLKAALTSSEILAYPSSDLKNPFILDADASNDGLGGVLSQVQDGKERVISFYSKTFLKAERNYCVTRRELLAVVSSIKHFHHYLYGRSFKVRSDHGALRWLLNFKNPEAQLARWFEILGSYDFVIEHRAGLKHGNADGLSRRPCHHATEDCKYCTRVEAKISTITTVEANKEEVLQQESSEKEGHWDVAVEALTRAQCKVKEVNDDKVIEEEEIVDSNLDDLEESVFEEATGEISNTKLREFQEKDKDIKIVLSWKLEDSKPVWADISAESEIVKYYWSRLDSYVIKENVLCRKWISDGKWEYRYVLPKYLRTFVLRQLHDSPVSGGHLGMEKTFKKISSRYTWYRLRDDVEHYCRICDTCASRKSVKKKAKSPLKQYVVGAPMERVAMDVLGPLPRTNKGNCYILVIADHFTKWVTAIPMKDQRAETVADLFIEHFVSVFGVPLSLHTDQGTNFCSNIILDVCRILGIHKTRTCPFRPQSDGLVERANRTIADMLSAYVSDRQNDWDEYLSLVLLAYRSAKQESTGVSPCEMVFGRNVHLPVDLVLGHPVPVQKEEQTSFAHNLYDVIENIHDLARSKLKLSSDRAKRNYDVKSELNKFNPGDAVWLFDNNRNRKKFSKRWKGPYIVIEKLNDSIYSIAKTKSSKSKTVHHDHLKPYKGENIK